LEYIVIGKPGTEGSTLRDSILQSMWQSKDEGGLPTLLEKLSSYRDITSRPCHKCHKLFDTKTLQLPLIRQATPPQDGQTPHFLALHRDCK